MSSTTVTWKFRAMDSLFFRDSRPMQAGESAWIESVFPPTGRTLQGAIRTAILDHLSGMNEYKDLLSAETTKEEISETNNYKKLLSDKTINKEIGDANSLKALSLTGPWLQENKETYYPVPLDLVKNKTNEYSLLKPSEEAVECDIGAIRLPELTTGGNGYKTVEECLISHQQMQALLEGNLDNSALMAGIKKLVAKEGNETAFADREPKVGLARDNATRTARKGMLFAIAPVRLREGVSIVVNIDGFTNSRYPKEPFLQRLGGEGKLAHVQATTPPQLPSAKVSDTDENTILFKIILATHANMPTQGWLPDGFEKVTSTDNTYEYWQGEIDTIKIDIISACIGKPFKQGGWDHYNHIARPLKSYVPAGSVYFCLASAKDKDAILALHGNKIGQETEYGFGHILIGQW